GTRKDEQVLNRCQTPAGCLTPLQRRLSRMHRVSDTSQGHDTTTTPGETNMLTLIRALGALTLSLAAAASQAAWPERPITLIVPFTPGTGIDLIARQLSAHLPGKLGQPVVVENLPGASGNIGTEKAARAAPDGYTFLVTVNTLVMNSSLYKGKLHFDPLKDFAPVGQTSWG